MSPELARASRYNGPRGSTPVSDLVGDAVAAGQGPCCGKRRTRQRWQPEALHQALTRGAFLQPLSAVRVRGGGSRP